VKTRIPRRAHRMSSWKGLKRPPIVPQRGHFLLAPCSLMRMSTHAWQMPQMHSVQAYESFNTDMLWQAAQYICGLWDE
jgi:hypothetical protein